MRNLYPYGVLAMFVLALAATGCQKKMEAPATGEETVATAAIEEEPEMPLALSEEAAKLAPGAKVAVMELEAGLVEIELFTDETPVTAGNFISLCEDKFYDGIRFHRVEPGFVVQAGDATSAGRANPDLTLEVERDQRKCLRGAISMARGFNQATGEYLATSPTQFFILLGDSPHLDPDFCVFGVVVTGMDIVDGIKQGDVIKRIRILTVGEEEAPTE